MGGQSPPKDHVAPAKCTPLNAGLRNKKGGSKERETKQAGAKRRDGRSRSDTSHQIIDSRFAKSKQRARAQKDFILIP